MTEKRCLLVGAQVFPYPTLSLGMLQAAVEADAALSGRVRVKARHFVSATAQEIAAEVVAEAPDILGVSCYVWNVGEFFEALPLIREKLPGTRIVLGGPDVGPRAAAVLRELPAADAVVNGEGEKAFPALLRAWLDGAEGPLPGVARRDGDGIVETPEAPPIADLDALPSPILGGLLPLDDDRITRFTVETSRGCPFDCKFCDWPGRRSKPREFSLDRVLAEMEYLIAHSKSLRVINLADADIFVDKARAKELLRRAKPILEGTRVVLLMEAYLGRLDDELMRLLDSPHFALDGGVQTATPEALKTMDRFFHRGKIEAAVARLHELSPRSFVTLQLIMGLPDDRLEGFLDTLDWALSMSPPLVAAFPALVLPGADMGQHPERYAMEYDPKPPRRVLSTPGFSRADMGAAALLAARYSAQSRLPVVRNTLTHLARLRPSGERPYVTLFRRFGETLAGLGLLPPDTVSAAEHDPFRHGTEVADGLLRDLVKRRAVLDTLRPFASAELPPGAPAGARDAFERYWAAEDAKLDWLEHAGKSTELDETAGPGRVWWLGLESLNAENALVPPGRGEFVHFHVPYPGPMRCGFPARHAARPGELPAGPAAGTVVLSHLYTRSDAPERSVLLKAAAASAGRGGRLVVLDTLTGRSPLESMGPLASWESEPWDGRRLETELAAAGWAAETTGRRLRGTHCRSFRLARN